MVAWLCKALGTQAEQELADDGLELSRGALGVMAVPLVCPVGGGAGNTAQGPSTHQGASGHLFSGPCGGEQPRPLLGTPVQLAHEPCGAVVTATLAAGPACKKKHSCVCTVFPHGHSIVLSSAHQKGGGETWEGVCVYDPQKPSGNARAEQRMEASWSPWPQPASPLGQGCVSGGLVSLPRPRPAACLSFLSCHSLSRKCS